MAFTDDDRKLLDIEGRFYRLAGAKDAAIRAELHMSSVRFAQRLVELLREREAWLCAPVTMRTVQDRIEARQRQMRAS